MARMPGINVHENVEKPDAYVGAAQSRIKNNRRIGNKRRWVEECGQETVDRCENFLFGLGEFKGKDKLGYHEDGEPYTIREDHPLVRAAYGDFYSKMVESVTEWGRLSEGQTKAVLGMIDRAQKRLDERAAAKAVKAATCKHIGAVGERRQFELTIKFITSFESMYGTTFVTIMEDSEGNTVVYKGNPMNGEKGDRVTFKATIKAHGERDGMPQTIISRPTPATVLPSQS